MISLGDFLSEITRKKLFYRRFVVDLKSIDPTKSLYQTYQMPVNVFFYKENTSYTSSFDKTPFTDIF